MNTYFRQASNSAIVRVDLYDSSSTVGAFLSSLAFNTSGLVIEAQRELDAAKTSYTVAGSNVEDITTLGTYAAPTANKIRFKETQLAGVYELHPAQALLSTGDASRYCDFKIYGATNLAPRVLRVWLTATNQQDGTRFGLAALPDAAAEAPGGLYTRGSGAGQINQPANGLIDVNAERWNNESIPATNQTGVPIVDIEYVDGTGVDPAGTVDVNVVSVSGSSGAADNLEIVFDTDFAVNYNTSLDKWNVNATHGAGTAWNSGAITSSTIGTDAIGSTQLAASAVSEIQSGLATAASLATVDNVVDAIQVVTDKLDDTLEDDGGVYRFTINALEQAPSGGGGGPSAADIADAVWDEATSGHTTSGTFGEQLKTDVDAILLDTDEIQGGWTLAYNGILGRVNTNVTHIASSTAQAEITSRVQVALENNNLDHLVKVAVDTDWATTVHLNSVLGHLADNGTSPTFDRTTDSFEALRDGLPAAVWGNGTRTLSGLGFTLGSSDFGTDWLTSTGIAASAVSEIQSGLSTHSAADVWSVGTRTLTSLDEDSTTIDLDATIRAALGMAAANFDTQIGDLPNNSELSAAIASGDDAVLAAIAALSIPTANQNADALLDRTSGIETGVTLRQAMRAIAANAAGLVSGAGTGTEVVKGIGQGIGGTTRLTATVDPSGNISGYALNL